MRPGDIHWVELSPAGGHEQVGRRPAIVLQDHAYAGALPLVIVVPLTGATAASRFAGTLLLVPTAENGLRQESVALVFQVRALDRRDLGERLGAVGEAALAEIHSLLDRLMGRATKM
ncbi:MAG: type II toxin-antitoxin system PemK/MazF family toxin [Armatimonadetes bacterium]|nr:type II toxin-antitoxin system PemK/MazF family toxin [Armatimonadota bacterium]